MGEQIANNRTMHGNIQLHENESGEYYPVVEWDEVPKLVRGEYIPIGNKIQFPKKWGRKRGALELLNFRIADKERVLADATKELELLTACRDKVREWPEE